MVCTLDVIVSKYYLFIDRCTQSKVKYHEYCLENAVEANQTVGLYSQQLNIDGNADERQY